MSALALFTEAEEHGLQAPEKARRGLGPRTHDGTITTLRPDEMWGTDATSTMLLTREVRGPLSRTAFSLSVIR